MTALLADKKILLGITGGIAAYKVIDWVRNLKREGADVTVLMTASATRFVSPLTLAALSGNKVYSDMFEQENAQDIPHISLARDTDLILVAPATATTLARLANGLADELLSAVILATEAKVLLCPAMNSKMYLHAATTRNMRLLREYGYTLIEPAAGEMACGEEGPGRLVEWENARHEILAAFSPQDLLGKRILITAGPTREPIDPARFISNRSTGKMGYALAATAVRRGGNVTLVSGPSDLPLPSGVEFIPVETAEQMRKAVITKARYSDIIIKAAAVSDFRAEKYSSKKVKKSRQELTLALKQNPDILKELGDKKKKSGKKTPILIGFAAESDAQLSEGLRKLKDKNLDMVVINDITRNDAGFAADTNEVIILDRDGTQVRLPLLSKEETADHIWNHIIRLLTDTSS